MTNTTSVTLTDDQVRYVDETCMNLSKFVRKAIERKIADGNTVMIDLINTIITTPRTEDGHIDMPAVQSSMLDKTLGKMGKTVEDIRVYLASGECPEADIEMIESFINDIESE